MEQTSTVRNLAGWLKANPWNPALTILYDLSSYGVKGESKRGALYLGEKERGRGRCTQVAQADILVRRENTRTVELIVEVDFRKTKHDAQAAPSPKNLVGLLLAAAAADNHTPSDEYEKTYKLHDTMIVVVTAYDTDQLLHDDQEFASELFERFHVAQRGVRALCICGGPTQEEIEVGFQALIRNQFFV
jgi:hypothetical protein